MVVEKIAHRDVLGISGHDEENLKLVVVKTKVPDSSWHTAEAVRVSGRMKSPPWAFLFKYEYEES